MSATVVVSGACSLRKATMGTPNLDEMSLHPEAESANEIANLAAQLTELPIQWHPYLASTYLSAELLYWLSWNSINQLSNCNGPPSFSEGSIWRCSFGGCWLAVVSRYLGNKWSYPSIVTTQQTKDTENMTQFNTNPYIKCVFVHLFIHPWQRYEN